MRSKTAAAPRGCCARENGSGTARAYVAVLAGKPIETVGRKDDRERVRKHIVESTVITKYSTFLVLRNNYALDGLFVNKLVE